jgi:hypothetical protein
VYLVLGAYTTDIYPFVVRHFFCLVGHILKFSVWSEHTLECSSIRLRISKILSVAMFGFANAYIYMDKHKVHVWFMLAS